MTCRICQLTNDKVRNAVELELLQGKGYLDDTIKNKLCDEYPEFAAAISAITQQDAEMHFNFHQNIQLIPTGDSVAKDINKDEASILYQMLNTQAATFNALNKQVNDALQENQEGLTTVLINPNVTEFYDKLAHSIRATVKEIRELNMALNGKKDDAIEGLKALAMALGGTKPQDDMTTKDFDD